jgi:hypothetical protein
MSYYIDLIEQALKLHASDAQLTFIKAAKSKFGEPIIDYKGRLKSDKDVILRLRLDRWITALEFNYKPAEHWQVVEEQARRMCL